MTELAYVSTKTNLRRKCAYTPLQCGSKGMCLITLTIVIQCGCKTWVQSYRLTRNRHLSHHMWLLKHIWCVTCINIRNVGKRQNTVRPPRVWTRNSTLSCLHNASGFSPQTDYCVQLWRHWFNSCRQILLFPLLPSAKQMLPRLGTRTKWVFKTPESLNNLDILIRKPTSTWLPSADFLYTYSVNNFRL